MRGFGYIRFPRHYARLSGADRARRKRKGKPSYRATVYTVGDRMPPRKVYQEIFASYSLAWQAAAEVINAYTARLTRVYPEIKQI